MLCSSDSNQMGKVGDNELDESNTAAEDRGRSNTVEEMKYIEDMLDDGACSPQSASDI